MNEFIIYSVYPNEDNIGGDEWGIDLEVNGELIAQFGDYYHDKGSEKAVGFIKGYAYIKGWKEKEDYIIKYDNRVQNRWY